MRKLTSLLLFLLFLGAQSAMAQDLKITGKVTDDAGEPLPGATVVAKGAAGVGTVTDFDGKYSLTVPSTVTDLQFSFVGLSTQVVAIGGRSVIDVVLTQGVDIEEVVVLGYGSVRSRDVTGAVARVGSEALEGRPIQSVDNALQGRAAGVQVTASSGAPGAAVQVRVRGTGSIFAGTDPLYIIDGVQVTIGDQTQMNTSQNALASLNPEDIESIEVLKDASTASIYGAQAANGVVIITTKRGSSGKTEFSFTATNGFAYNIRDMPILTGDQLTELSVEAFRNSYGVNSPVYKTRIRSLLGRGFLTTEDGSENTPITGYTAPNSDWKDAIFRNGRIQTYQLSAAGGTDKTRFYLSGSYTYNEGPVMETDFQRATTRINLSHTINDRVTIDFSSDLSTMFGNTVTEDATYANPYNSALGLLPTDSIQFYDGSYNRELSGGFTFNVVEVNKNNIQRYNQNRAIPSFSLNVKIAEGLSFRSTYGLDYLEIREDMFWDPRHGDGEGPNGVVAMGNTRVLNWQTNQVLSYNKLFGQKHDFSAIAGFEYRFNLTDYGYASAQALPTYKLQTLFAAAEPTNAYQYNQDWRLMGIFGRVNYSYDGKYLVSATVRRDASSRFGANNRFGVFPAASAAWRVSAEPFMQWASAYLNDWKLKVGYGWTGNSSIRPYRERSFFTGGSEYGNAAGFAPSTLGDPDLTWETNQSLNVGTSFELLTGRIRGEVNYYHNYTPDLLLPRPLPATSGYDNIWSNIGEMLNKGWEFQVNVGVFAMANFRWDIDANFTSNYNEVVSLVTPENDDEWIYMEDEPPLGATETDYYLRWAHEGDPIGTIRSRDWAGVNPADGRPMWYDQNGEITYSPLPADRIWTGYYTDPRYFGGFGNNFTLFKNLEVNVFFQYAFGHYKYNANSQLFGDYTYRGGQFNQYLTQYTERWMEPGDNTYVPKVYTGVSGYLNNTNSVAAMFPSTRDIEKADHLRLKNIMVSYALPTDWVKRVKFSSVKVFAQATNLYTWTTYTGWDPEIIGPDWGVYPQTKNLTFGIKTSF